MQRALVIIKEEHRALAAVMHGLAYLMAEIGQNRVQPDFRLLRAMLDYVEGFPDRLHHPKEDAYLFRALRRRAPQAAEMLDRLEAEHRQGPEDTATLQRLLDGFEQNADGFAAFAAAVNECVDSTFRHMAAEEGKVLPLAMQVLTAEDWVEINEAFAANNDPMIGMEAQREFRDLFSRILALAPAPIGFG